MIEYALNAPTNILIREEFKEANSHPQKMCEMCARDGKHVVATHLFNIKSCRYYMVCEDHYQFLAKTGGIKEQLDMGLSPEREKDETN